MVTVSFPDEFVLVAYAFISILSVASIVSLGMNTFSAYSKTAVLRNPLAPEVETGVWVPPEFTYKTKYKDVLDPVTSLVFA